MRFILCLLASFAAGVIAGWFARTKPRQIAALEDKIRMLDAAIAWNGRVLERWEKKRIG